MEILLFAMAWYATGAVGAAIMCWVWWFEDDLPVRLEDVGFALVFAVGGPIVLAAVLGGLFCWLVIQAGTAILRIGGWSADTIVIQPRRRRR